MTRLFVGAGREAGIRPQDLVGAITGETRLQGRQIGGIRIADRFSLVEVPEGRRRGALGNAEHHGQGPQGQGAP
jgi:hypothetical protein